MSPATPRIDLDGVALTDARETSGTALAIFRHRSVEGLVLLMPESAEFLVTWDDVASASLDLVGGAVEIRFEAAYVAHSNRLRGADRLVGRWMDRFTQRGRRAEPARP